MPSALDHPSAQGGGSAMRTKSCLSLAILALLVALYALPVSAQRFAHVTGVTVEADPPSYEGSCPKTFRFTGIIAVDRGGRAKYRWMHSDGGHRVATTTVFSGPEAHTVRDSWTLGNASTAFKYNGNVRLQILLPSTAHYGKAMFSLNCVPRSSQKKAQTGRPKK
jgi:hypothetical protein